MSFFKYFFPFSAQKNESGSFDPSIFTQTFFISDKTNYEKQEHEVKYTGDKPILVVCTDEALLEMENKKNFSTGNHPVEMLVPMLHMRDAGFTFDVATVTGSSVKFEMWAFPNKDENVKDIHAQLKAKLDAPKKLADIKNLDDYSAVFIPGGHGAMINLPKSPHLGRLLHEAHAAEMPTVTLCHGPAALLSTALDGKEFAYEGYEIMCFSDATDSITPYLGYLPGKMPWKVQDVIEKKKIKVKNTTEKGDVTSDRELITGDSPGAAEALGRFAAPKLVEWANKHRA